MYNIHAIKAIYFDNEGKEKLFGYFRSLTAFKQYIKELNEKRDGEYAKESDYTLSEIRVWNI